MNIFKYIFCLCSDSVFMLFHSCLYFGPTQLLPLHLVFGEMLFCLYFLFLVCILFSFVLLGKSFGEIWVSGMLQQICLVATVWFLCLRPCKSTRLYQNMKYASKHVDFWRTNSYGLVTFHYNLPDCLYTFVLYCWTWILDAFCCTLFA